MKKNVSPLIGKIKKLLFTPFYNLSPLFRLLSPQEIALLKKFLLTFSYPLLWEISLFLGVISPPKRGELFLKFKKNLITPINLLKIFNHPFLGYAHPKKPIFKGLFISPLGGGDNRKITFLSPVTQVWGG